MPPNTTTAEERSAEKEINTTTIHDVETTLRTMNSGNNNVFDVNNTHIFFYKGNKVLTMKAVTVLGHKQKIYDTTDLAFKWKKDCRTWLWKGNSRIWTELSYMSKYVEPVVEPIPN